MNIASSTLLVEETVDEFARVVFSADLPPKWKVLLATDPWSGYRRLRAEHPKAILNMPLPPKIELSGCEGGEGTPFSWIPVDDNSVLFVPYSVCVGRAALAVFLSLHLLGSYPDLRVADIGEVLSYRAGVARDLLRSWGVEVDERLIEESVLRSTKIWPILAILLDVKVTEVYATVGRSVVVDHLDLGRREVLNLRLDNSDFSRLKTIADSAPFTLLDSLHPSAKVDLRAGRIRARISLDVDPFSPPSVDVRNLSALTALSMPRLISGGYVDPRDASVLIRGVVGGIPTLVAGPTGSGKTTLSNAILSCLPPGWRILSVELVREVEDKTDQGFIHQRFIAKNRTKGDVLLELLHRNPDVTFMGEILEAAHAEAFASAADAGLRVLATTHAGSPDSLLRRWGRWGLSDAIVMSNLAVMGRGKNLLGVFRFRSGRFERIKPERDELSDFLADLPAFLDNPATAAAVAEYWGGHPS